MADELVLVRPGTELGIPTEPGVVVGGGTSSSTGTGGTTSPVFPTGNVGGGPGAGFGTHGGPDAVVAAQAQNLSYTINILGQVPAAVGTAQADAQFATSVFVRENPNESAAFVQQIYNDKLRYFQNRQLNITANPASDPGSINVGFSGTLGGDVPNVPTNLNYGESGGLIGPPIAPANVPYTNPNLGLFGTAGAQGGALFEDILGVDYGLDRAGAFLGSLTDILAVTGVIPTGGGSGRVTAPVSTQTNGTLAALREQNQILAGLLAQQGQAGGAPATQQPGGIPMPFNPAPSAMPGGAPIGVPASYTPVGASGGWGLDFPLVDFVPQGTTTIQPRQSCSMRLPSRVDVPTRDARGNVRFTTFKNMGRPLLWSGDLAASKRVRKVAAKARRAKGR